MKWINSGLPTVCALFGVAATLMLLTVDADARSRSSSSSSSRSSSSARSHAGKSHGHNGTRLTSIRRTVIGGSRAVSIAPFVGSSWYYTAPYDAYGFYAHVPPVYVQTQGELYMEPSQIAEQPGVTAPQQDYWYYCEETKTYYPYVATCASPWAWVIPYPQ